MAGALGPGHGAHPLPGAAGIMRAAAVTARPEPVLTTWLARTASDSRLSPVTGHRPRPSSPTACSSPMRRGAGWTSAPRRPACPGSAVTCRPSLASSASPAGRLHGEGAVAPGRVCTGLGTRDWHLRTRTTSTRRDIRTSACRLRMRALTLPPALPPAGRSCATLPLLCSSRSARLSSAAARSTCRRTPSSTAPSTRCCRQRPGSPGSSTDADDCSQVGRSARRLSGRTLAGRKIRSSLAVITYYKYADGERNR